MRLLFKAHGRHLSFWIVSNAKMMSYRNKQKWATAIFQIWVRGVLQQQLCLDEKVDEKASSICKEGKKSYHPCKNCWGPDVKNHYSLFISEGSAVKYVNQVVLCGLGCSTWLFYRLMLLVLSQHVTDQYKSNSYQYRTKLLDKGGAYYDLYTMSYIYINTTHKKI